MLRPLLLLTLALSSCTFVPVAGRCTAPPGPVRAPLVDHHQHLLSEPAHRATVEFLRAVNDPYLPVAERQALTDADGLVQMLDSAGIERAVVYSNAYYMARMPEEGPDERAAVAAENDWTLAQVQRHPTRLRAACSVNPLRAYAEAEVARCAERGGFVALKLHFDASGVDLQDPAHLARVQAVFAAANRLAMPLVVHLQRGESYGAAQATTFLTAVLPSAPDVPVTLNHLWGGGRYHDGARAALQALAEAVERRAPGTERLRFDIAQASMIAFTEDNREEVAQRMRQIGFSRLLYGSDGPQWSGVPPQQHWTEFRACMPLTPAEFDSLASSVAAFVR